MSLHATAKFSTVCSCLLLLAFACASLIAAHGPVFQPQTRLGFTVGDQWEPSIAADAYGHVYILFPQFGTIPGCASCPSPTMFLIISSDNGATWSAPRIIAPLASGQIDVQIKVDPVDGRTVHASWLQNSKSLIEVAKSVDFGATWTTVIANQTQAGTDKDILVVKGNDVYVGYNHAQTIWVSSSHDGGQTFTSAKVNQNAQFGWSLTGGAAIDRSGNVYFAWSGYSRNGQAKGPVNLYVTKSSDGGNTWTATLLDVSGSPPDCSAFFCGWAYLGPGIAMTSDAAGEVYVLWNAGTVEQGPERIWFFPGMKVPRGPRSRMSPLRPPAWTMLFLRLSLVRPGTCALHGWTSATHRTGTSTIALPSTEERRGLERPNSPPSFRTTLTSSPMDSGFRSATILIWRSIIWGMPRLAGGKVLTGSNRVRSGTRASCDSACRRALSEDC